MKYIIFTQEEHIMARKKAVPIEEENPNLKG